MNIVIVISMGEDMSEEASGLTMKFVLILIIVVVAITLIFATNAEAHGIYNLIKSVFSFHA